MNYLILKKGSLWAIPEPYKKIAISFSSRKCGKKKVSNHTQERKKEGSLKEKGGK